FRIALAYQDPALEFQHRRAVLAGAAGMDIDDAALAGGGLLEADDAAFGGKGVAWIDGLQKAALRVAQVGDGIEGYLGDGLSEDHVEDQQVVQRNVRQALCAGRLTRGVQEKATAGECQVEAGLSRGEGPGGRVAQDLAGAEVLVEVAAARVARALDPTVVP